MTKQIKISEFMFKKFWNEKKKRELQIQRTLSYSEFIGLLLGYEVSEIRKRHKNDRYKKFHNVSGDHGS